MHRTVTIAPVRNFERMGPADGAKMRNDVDYGWPGLLALYAKAVEGK